MRNKSARLLRGPFVRISLRIHQHGWGLVVRPSMRGDTGHIPRLVSPLFRG